MRQGIYEIISNHQVARDTFELKLRGDTAGIRPGQFCEIKAEGFFLRRPFSVCGAEDNVLTVCYHVSGKGTETMSKIQSGTLDVLTELGNGYDMSVSGESPLLIGGGTGITPLCFLAKELLKAGKCPRVIMGFASKEDVFKYDEIKALGIEVTLMTADGSAGRKGLVTDAIDEADYTHIYSCGPVAMFRAISEKAKTGAQLSLEARMGCGFGACMGCTIETKNGMKRVCKEGPVFTAEEIKW